MVKNEAEKWPIARVTNAGFSITCAGRNDASLVINCGYITGRTIIASVNETLASCPRATHCWFFFAPKIDTVWLS